MALNTCDDEPALESAALVRVRIEGHGGEGAFRFGGASRFFGTHLAQDGFLFGRAHAGAPAGNLALGTEERRRVHGELPLADCRQFGLLFGGLLFLFLQLLFFEVVFEDGVGEVLILAALGTRCGGEGGRRGTAGRRRGTADSGYGGGAQPPRRESGAHGGGGGGGSDSNGWCRNSREIQRVPGLGGGLGRRCEWRRAWRQQG